MPKALMLLGCAAGALLINSTSARADTAASTEAAQTSTTVADVVVTAEKREATVQTVATAITAFTAKQRQVIGVDTLVDLQNFTPGLRYAPALDRIFLRGVGRQTNNLATDPGVATYIDGVYDAATYDAGGDSLFIARTEVLRGPQGTLYGRNSIGGAINVISVQPTSTFYAEGRARVGNYGYYDVEAATSGPINDHVRFRLAGSWYDQHYGYFRNVAIPGQSEDGNASLWYFEGQIAADLAPNVDLWVRATVADYNGTYRSTNVVSPYDTSEVSFGTLSPNLAYAYNPAFVGSFTQAGTVMTNPAVTNQWLYNTASPSLIKISPNYTFIWHLNWHADGFDVKYIGGWAHHFIEINDGAGNGAPVTSITYALQPGSTCALLNFFGDACGPLTLKGPTIFHYIEDKTWYSHELDFISTGPSNFQWIGGLYYYHEDYDQPVAFPEPNVPQMATPLVPFSGIFTPPEFAAPNPSRSVYTTDENMHADSYAGFGQIDWKFAPAWKVTLGLRYTYDDKAGVESTRVLCMSCLGIAFFLPQNLGTLTPVYDITAGSISFAPAPGAGPVTFNAATGYYSRPLSGNWSGVTGTAGVEWTPQPDLLTFLKYSRGYKSGGFNGGAIVATPEVGPESLDSIEGGVKKVFAQRLTVNAALFWYNYENMQIELGENENGTTKFFLQGLPRVRNWGFELESTWQATSDLQFTLSYAYLNTRIEKAGCFADSIRAFHVSDAACVVAGSPNTNFGLFTVTGDHLIDSPPNKIAINANYTLHFDPGRLTFSVSDTWTDGHFSSIFNTPDYFSPSYNNLDLRMLWNDAKDRYTIIVYGKNVLNAVEYDYIYPGTNPFAAGVTHSLFAPVTYGAEFQVRFR
jgi:iron complex outermembrane receptor protein